MTSFFIPYFCDVIKSKETGLYLANDEIIRQECKFLKSVRVSQELSNKNETGVSEWPARLMRLDDWLD